MAHKRRPARLLPAQHQLNRNVHKARAIEDECTHNRSERATQAKEMRAHKDTALRTPLRKALERQQQSAGFHHIAVGANLTLSAREANRRRLARERGNSTLWAICACARWRCKQDNLQIWHEKWRENKVNNLQRLANITAHPLPRLRQSCELFAVTHPLLQPSLRCVQLEWPSRRTPSRSKRSASELH